MKKLSFITLFILLLSTTKVSAFTEGAYNVTVEKQRQKQSSRWTLLNWLGTKKKVALMDQWLVLNTKSSWFEFILDYNKGSIDPIAGDTSELNHESYGASLYIKLLGFQYEKTKISTRYTIDDYRLSLILLGTSSQSTNLQVIGGRRDLTLSANTTHRFNQKYLGLSATFYLLDFIAITSEYRNYQETESEQNSSLEMDGHRLSYGAFIEYSIFRIYAQKFHESLVFNNNSFGATQEDNNGTSIGLRLFF